MHPDDQRQDIAARISDRIADMVGNTPQSAEYRLISDLSFDSLDMVELAMGLEEEFQIEIPDDDWDDIGDARIADLTDFIAARLAAKVAA